jgi:hypothetical protein
MPVVARVQVFERPQTIVPAGETSAWPLPILPARVSRYWNAAFSWMPWKERASLAAAPPGSRWRDAADERAR